MTILSTFYFFPITLTNFLTSYYFPSIENGSIFYLLECSNHTLASCWMPCCRPLILCLYIFACLALFTTFTQSHNSNMDNVFRIIIIIIKTIIIKVNIISICSLKACIITKNVALLESSIKRTISSLENTTSPSFSNILLLKNELGTNFSVGRKASTDLSHISCVLYLSMQFFSKESSLETTLSLIFWFLHWSRID